MLKRFSVFALATLLIVGCSSNEEDEAAKNKRPFKETVYAFVNSNPNIGGFGRVDFNAIMKDGQIESNEAFKMFGNKEYSELKKQLDFTTPMYFAMEPTKNEEVIGYVFAKLKHQDAFVAKFQQSGYTFKEHKGITYAEDGDFVWGLRNETIIIVIHPGKFNGKKEITKAFKFADGKLAGDELKQQLERPGDVIMHINAEKMAANSDVGNFQLKGTALDFSLNFEKGKMIFEALTNNADALRKELQIETEDAPLIAKKITNAEGETVMAMQSRMGNPLLNMALNNDLIMEEVMTNLTKELMNVDASLTLSNIDDLNAVTMPESGQSMGGESFEMMLDLNVLAKLQPDYSKYTETLNYATLVMTDSSMKLVVTTDKTGENFLATILKLGEKFFMSGDWMQLAMQ